MRVDLEHAGPDRYYRDDAVRWIWISYGLAQAVVTMLIAFGVLESVTVSAVVTAVALVLYVGVNEVFVRPRHTRQIDRTDPPAPDPPAAPYDEDTPADPCRRPLARL